VSSRLLDALSILRVRAWLAVAAVGAWIDREPFGPCFSWAMKRAASAVRYPDEGENGDPPW